MSPSRLHMMRFFRPRVLNPADLPEEVADRARALAVALANPYTPYDERVVLRRAFSKRLSTQVWSVRFSAWDEFNRELWRRYEASAPTCGRRLASAQAGRDGAKIRGANGMPGSCPEGADSRDGAGAGRPSRGNP